MSTRISVIIPTLLDPQRGPLIQRAVDSVLEQAEVDVSLVLVVNGSQRDASQFEASTGVRVVRLERPDLPAALHAGRRAVDSQYFSILDDDDYLLPGALKTRLDLLQAHPDGDAVITNGIVHSRGVERRFAPDMKAFSDDPLEALGDRNWLSPGSALMRTERVPAELFAGTPRYLEWTYLAVQLASTCRLLFDDRATFVYDEDAPNRVSRSAAYLFGQPAALERILALDLPGGLREKLERDHSGALHAIAQERLERRELAAAWRAHLSSLLGRGGLRFFLSTRKFLGLP